MKDFDVATRVAQGVALLDEKKPGWVGLINLSRFAISTTDNCVLGQVYGDYGDGCQALYLGYGEEYGFTVKSNGMVNVVLEFRALQDEWTRVLTILRQKREAQERETVTV